MAGAAEKEAGLAVTTAQTPAEAKFKFADFFIIPVRVHLLSAKNVPAWHTTLTEKDVERVIPRINQIWAQAGVTFYLESIVREEAVNQDRFKVMEKEEMLELLPQIRPPDSYDKKSFHVYYVKDMPSNGHHYSTGIFVKDAPVSQPVEKGTDEPLARVTAHELGHGLGLIHRQSVTNLMASKTTGIALNNAEINRARKAAKGMERAQPATKLLVQADALAAEKKAGEARNLYQQITNIPIRSEEVDRAWKRAGE